MELAVIYQRKKELATYLVVSLQIFVETAILNLPGHVDPLSALSLLFLTLISSLHCPLVKREREKFEMFPCSIQFSRIRTAREPPV